MIWYSTDLLPSPWNQSIFEVITLSGAENCTSLFRQHVESPISAETYKTTHGKCTCPFTCTLHFYNFKCFILPSFGTTSRKYKMSVLLRTTARSPKGNSCLMGMWSAINLKKCSLHVNGQAYFKWVVLLVAKRCVKHPGRHVPQSFLFYLDWP